MTCTPSARCIEISKQFESYMQALPDGRCQSYRCVVGHNPDGSPIYDKVWTIGWGTTRGITQGMIWTREQADQAHRDDMQVAADIVSRNVKVPLNQNQADACILLANNIGEGGPRKAGFSTSTVLKRINAGNFQGAAEAFSMWVNSNGVKGVPGLVRRRAQEAALFLEPDADAVDTSEPLPDAQGVEEDAPSSDAWHAQAHEALKDASGVYNANRGLVKLLGGAIATAGMFLQEHALEIGLCLFVGVTVLLLLQLTARNKWIATQ